MAERLVQMHVNVFLERYNSSSDFERTILERQFARAVGDLVEDKGWIFNKKLKEIREEAFLDNGMEKTRQYIQLILKAGDFGLMKTLDPYLLPFVSEEDNFKYDFELDLT